MEAENADEAAMTENTDTNAAAEAQEAEAPAEIYAGRLRQLLTAAAADAAVAEEPH